MPRSEIGLHNFFEAPDGDSCWAAKAEVNDTDDVLTFTINPQTIDDWLDNQTVVVTNDGKRKTVGKLNREWAHAQLDHFLDGTDPDDE